MHFFLPPNDFFSFISYIEFLYKSGCSYAPIYAYLSLPSMGEIISLALYKVWAAPFLYILIKLANAWQW